MSATKRRAGAAASPELSTPDPVKRRKRNDDTHYPDEENVETTTEIGMKLIRLLKRSKDKNGRDIASHFLDLPSKEEYPQYYVQVKMPLSLNMIEDRLENGQYDTLEKVESDLKRLIQNAKEFNSTKSEVYEDAERLRKAMSNFMPKHNPAYLDSNYRAYPTPIPQDLLDRGPTPQSATTNGQPEKVKLVLTNNRAVRRKSRDVSTVNGEDEDNNELAAAQLKLLDELSEMPDAVNFEEKPPRNIPGYYKVIKRPTSISDVRRMVEEGKVHDWNSLAAEVRLIWSNAKEFNEDGSEIYEMAEELERWFEQRVQALGAAPPASIKLTVSQPPSQPKLKLNISRATTSTPTSAIVETESQRRQKEETGQALIQPSRADSRITTTNGSTPVPQNIKRSNSVTDSQRSGAESRPTSNQANTEFLKSSATAQNHVSRSIPTPAMEGYPPQTRFTATPTLNGIIPPENSYAQKPASIYAESDNPIDRKYRDPGKGLKDAILGSVTFMTHPDLQNNPKWRLDRYASETMTQTCSYIYLPSDHYYLRVIPHLTDECHRRRRYKVCVTRNWEQMHPNQNVPGAYDFRIHPGENIVAVDVIADLAEGDSKPYAPPQLQVDFERITFIIMLRPQNSE